MQMELRHLRYFCAIAAEGHITRAAAGLAMRQPPLSQQLRLLEAEVGAALFLRTPRGVTLTAAGQAFLPLAQAALAAAAQAGEAARRAAEGQSGVLRIGFVTSAALHPAVPRLLRTFAGQNPAVALTVTEGNAAEVTDGILAGLLDAGLLRVPVAPIADCVLTELLREPALLALPSGHPALGGTGAAGPPVPLRALVAERFILVQRGPAPGLYADLLAACRRAGFEPEVVQRVPRMLTNLNLVAAGLGVSVVPASMRGIHPGQVAYRAIADRPGLDAPLNLLHRADPPPVVQRFAALADGIARWDAGPGGSGPGGAGPGGAGPAK